MFDYSVYSVALQSEVELVGFCSKKIGEQGDVLIYRKEGMVNAAYASNSVEASRLEGGVLFYCPFGSNYLVKNGESIAIISNSGVDPCLELLPLQGMVLAALLWQRGMIVLHACALDIGGKGIVVVGAKGTGKSTIALGILERGGRLLSDDVTVMTIVGEKVILQPGPQLMKAWPDSLELNGVDVCQCPVLFKGTDKRMYFVPDHLVSKSPIELTAVVFLQDAEIFDMRQLTGAEKLTSIEVSLYMARYKNLRSSEEMHQDFINSAVLSKQTTMYLLKRPKRQESLEEACMRIAEISNYRCAT